jgi:7-cyano-7-deazaguanine synthase
MKTILLFSGGMDSATLLAYLKARDHEVMCLSFRYGSLHESAEGRAALHVADYYHSTREILNVNPEIFAGSKSALLGNSPMPDKGYQIVDDEGPSSTVVPFRNAIMLSQAVAVAESRGYGQVAIANHANDYAHWAYPDCSPEFIGAFTAAAYAGTAGKVRVVSPFMYSTKSDIVLLAHELSVPLQHTWSCYRGEDLHCGICPTCLERIMAFSLAGFIDPVNYLRQIQWPEDCVEYL